MLLKPCVPLNCEVAHLTAYSPRVIVSNRHRLHSSTVKLDNLSPGIAFGRAYTWSGEVWLFLHQFFTWCQDEMLHAIICLITTLIHWIHYCSGLWNPCKCFVPFSHKGWFAVLSRGVDVSWIVVSGVKMPLQWYRCILLFVVQDCIVDIGHHIALAYAINGLNLLCRQSIVEMNAVFVK